MTEREAKLPMTGGVDTLDVDANAYQLTLAGMVIPLSMHFAFNGVSALSMLLLGHPGTAAVAFAASCLADTIFRSRIVHWLAADADIDPVAGFRKLAPLCAMRGSILLWPVVVLAIRGGPAEMAYFATVFSIFVVLAGSNGSFSRRVFWSYAGPAVAACVIVTLANFTGATAVAIMLAILSLSVLLALICEGTTKTITVWQSAFSDSRALVSELQVARDQAVVEREAADEAREDARRANRAKSNFLATMSHEIRTPMNGVLGMAQLLKRDEADPAQTSRLDTLIESGEYLLSILNDILDVSKVDAGRLDIQPHAEDLPLFLDRLVAFWSARADEQGVALHLRADQGLPHFIWMDALRVRQVLFNLIGNALKFTTRGSVTVAASARAHGEGAIWLHVAVTDTGPGIPAKDLSRLFERFSQVDDSEGRQFGGTGLGLAIARQLTELMGGRVWVESQVGRGSTFHIEAPFDLAQAPGEIEASPPDDDELGPAPPMAVLIVDDNPVNLLVLDQILSAFGHRIDKAASGPEALAALAERAFDLAILDVQMPGMTGIEVLEHLRAAAGPNQWVPVMALTADVVSGGRPHYLGLGFDEHSSKPIQIADLMAAVARAAALPPRGEAEVVRSA